MFQRILGMSAALFIVGALRVRAQSADSSDARIRRFSIAAGAGAVSFPGGREEQATAIAFRVRLAPWLTLGTTPSFVHATEPATTRISSQSRSGFTDLPIALEAEHEFATTLAPSVGAEATVTLPTGDTASGLGNGSVGYAIGASTGLSPAPWMHLYGGAGRSLSGFSVQGVLNGSSSNWGYVGASTPIGGDEAGDLGFEYETDLGSVDPTIGRSQSISSTVAWSVARIGDISLTASHGISGIAPSWAFALRVGVGWVGLGTSNRNSIEQIQQTFGGGPHGASGSTPGSSGSGHGRGRKSNP